MTNNRWLKVEGVSNWTSSRVIGERVRVNGPLMNFLELEVALEMEASIVDAMDVDSVSVQDIQYMKIPLEEIRSATRDFTIPCKPENKIKRVSVEEILEYPKRESTVAIKSIDGGYEQRTEERLQKLLYLSHINLVKLVGFCDEDDERIHFCLYAARRLNFLHNGNGKNDTIIHGNIKSSNILISRDGVGMIVLNGALTHFKISDDDPKFLPDIVKRGFNPQELDNIIGPMLRQEFEKYRSLIVNRSAKSLNMFANIAYQCFQEKAKGRPTMADIVEELEKAYKYHVQSLEQRQEDEDNSKMENLKHLKIPFKEIYSATNGFVDSRMIRWGGFGGVYRAELYVDVRKYVGKKESLVELYCYPRRKGKVALKRREITSDQGRKEFWKEIDGLSGLNHQNIVSLVGFCYEYGEMIILYDYASNGSFENADSQLKCYMGDLQDLQSPEKNRASLVDMAECHISNDQPSRIIHDYLRNDLEDEKLLDSVKTFAAIAHECLHSTDTHRLTMADVLKELKKALTVH
ncbi:phloem protein 2-like protein, partial [Tanacetum coccineum]